MDPDAFSAASWFKWDPRAPLPFENRLLEAVEPPLPPAVCSMRLGELGGLEELFESYGVRYFTAAKLYELGFTVETLLDMRDEELDEMMESVCQIFRWDLLFGERYGIKSAVRAERRRIVAGDATYVLDAFPQEGLSEEPVQQGKEAVGCGGGLWEIVAARSGNVGRMRKFIKGRSRLMGSTEKEDDGDDTDRADDDDHGRGGGERLREHPFIVTEPGEVARGKKNGLDYLFHLYELCREFLIQVQHIAKERGEKCPTKVTNQVFRYAKKAGANYINKPKMRHYVHCYALHCLDEAASNALRRAFKERGENVGTWRQACYKPLVGISASQGWDIDAIFNAHPRLSVWYVPTNLRQLCHAERRSEAAFNCPFSASM